MSIFDTEWKVTDRSIWSMYHEHVTFERRYNGRTETKTIRMARSEAPRLGDRFSDSELNSLRES